MQPFVAGEPLLGEGDEFGFVGRRILMQNDEPMHPLPPFLVRNADDGDVLHRIMGTDDVLDFLRIDVFFEDRIGLQPR